MTRLQTAIFALIVGTSLMLTTQAHAVTASHLQCLPSPGSHLSVAVWGLDEYEHYTVSGTTVTIDHRTAVRSFLTCDNLANNGFSSQVISAGPVGYRLKSRKLLIQTALDTIQQTMVLDIAKGNFNGDIDLVSLTGTGVLRYDFVE